MLVVKGHKLNQREWLRSRTNKKCCIYKIYSTW